jgi:hypothetical protein
MPSYKPRRNQFILICFERQVLYINNAKNTPIIIKKLFFTGPIGIIYKRSGKFAPRFFNLVSGLRSFFPEKVNDGTCSARLFSDEGLKFFNPLKNQ